MQNNQNQAIWNPKLITRLSLLFTPIFGSYLIAANWRSLGHPERAASARVWLYISLLVIVAMIGMNAYVQGNQSIDRKSVSWILDGTYLAYLLVWGFATVVKQVKYVDEELGADYAKKSLFKPIICALGLTILVATILVGLLIATQDIGGNSGQTTAQASTPSDKNSGLKAGSPFSISSLFSSGQKLDCGAPEVKKYVADIYEKQLFDTGIPDLVSAVEDHRVTAHVEAIHETARNTESKYVNCAANVVINFPKDDLVRAAQQGEIFQYLMLRRNLAPVTDSAFTAPITYQLATPSDAEERKQGPIITMTTKDSAAVAQQLGPYITYYQVLAYAAPDISSASVNSTPWGKDFKGAAIQTCSKQLGVAHCTCEFDALEKIVGEKQVGRIIYTFQAAILPTNHFPNFLKVVGALRQQCPLTQNIAAILGDSAVAANQGTSSTQQSEQSRPESSPPVATSAQPGIDNAPPQEGLMPISPASAPHASESNAATISGGGDQQSAASESLAQVDRKMNVKVEQPAAIVASFDCSRAASRIEKLICSTPETAASDRRLAAAYSVARSKSNDPNTLKADQRKWLVNERNACSDAACLVKVTDARIQALAAM